MKRTIANFLLAALLLVPCRFATAAGGSAVVVDSLTHHLLWPTDLYTANPVPDPTANAMGLKIFQPGYQQGGYIVKTVDGTTPLGSIIQWAAFDEGGSNDGGSSYLSFDGTDAVFYSPYFSSSGSNRFKVPGLYQFDGTLRLFSSDVNHAFYSTVTGGALSFQPSDFLPANYVPQLGSRGGNQAGTIRFYSDHFWFYSQNADAWRAVVDVDGSTNQPTRNISLSGSHWVGTLDDDRLSPNVPLLDVDGNLTSVGLLLKTSGGSPYATFAYDGDLGLTIADGWGQSIDINSDNNGLMLNNMPLTLNGGGIYDQQSGLYVYLPGGQLGPLDATNLINVPPPAGFQLGGYATGGDGIFIGHYSYGDFYVTDGSGTGNYTMLLSSTNTLGSQLTGYDLSSAGVNNGTDGSGLVNLPPPAGLNIVGSSYISVGNAGVGSFEVGDSGFNIDTFILSAPNVLGPLDAENLTGLENADYAGDNLSNYIAANVTQDSINNALATSSLFVGNAISASAIYTQSVYFSDDGTGYLANGSISWDAEGNLNANAFNGALFGTVFNPGYYPVFSISGTSYYPHVTAGVLSFTDAP